MKYLLDADSIVDHLTRHANLQAQLPALGPQDLALGAPTLIELYTGVYESRNPAQAERDLRVFLRLVAIVPLNRRVILATARLRAELLQRKLPIKHRAYDLIAAAMALEYDLVLVSSDAGYDDIPNLRRLNPRTSR